MARARNIKPSIMDNEDLAELDPLTRLLFVYLWMLADREGRLEDRPKRIGAQALAYDRSADVNAMLDDLMRMGFILRYKADGIACIQIVAFDKHQNPHVRESSSELPKPGQGTAKAMTRHDLGSAEASPRSPDPGFLIPDSLIEDTQPPAAKPVGFSLPDWINKTHWDAWHSSPKREKATDAQKQLAVDKLAKWRAEGIDYATALESAAVGGWQGLFLPDKGKPTNVQTLTVPARNGRDPELERLERDRDRAVAPSLAVLEQMAKIRMGAKA